MNPKEINNLPNKPPCLVEPEFDRLLSIPNHVIECCVPGMGLSAVHRVSVFISVSA